MPLRCKKCRLCKPASEFMVSRCKYSTPKFVRPKTCKTCIRSKNLEWRAANRDKVNAIVSRWKSKRTDDDKTLFMMQNRLNACRSSARKGGYKECTSTAEELKSQYKGVCEVCGRSGDEYVRIDHCHKTGKFRGFLCHHCNVILGMCNDDPDRLRALIQYLEERNNAT